MATNFIITGTIYNAFDEPLTDVKVSAFDLDFRIEQLLGEAITDARGAYSISYDKSQFESLEHKSADVFIRVTKGRRELGKSPVYYNASENLVVNFKIGKTPIKGTPEFDSLVNTIQPLLERQRITIADLKEGDAFQDISFLSNEIGESFEKISFLPLSFVYSQQTAIPPDIFYGLFRTSFPTELNELFLVKSESLKSGLKTSMSQNIISSRWEDKIDEFVEKFNELSSDFILKGENPKNVAFRESISAALPEVKLQQKFIKTFFENESTPEKFWDKLANDDDFKNGNKINDTKKAVSLHLLTGAEPALTTALFEESKRDPDLTDLRGFAKFGIDDWREKITKLVDADKLKNFPEGVKGNTIRDKIDNYATTIETLVTSTFPTDVFAQKLARDPRDPFPQTKQDLKTFFSNNPEFDLQTSRFNKNFEASKLENVRDKEALKKELKKINLLSKLSPVYDHVSVLGSEGVDSATAIVGKFTLTEFQKKFESSIPNQEAKTIYKNAVKMDRRSTALALAYKMRHDVPIYAITGNDPVPNDYQTMFGGNSLCDCNHCSSVYSPAAYLTDLLNFLKKNNSDAFTKLTERRPDLIEIVLNCKNTNTALPYIDLVNELLESIVANQTTVAFQTENTSKELEAFPQNIIEEAYDKLKTSASAYQLPLDLHLEASRRILRELDLEKQEVLELILPKGATNIYNNAEIAKEVIGFSSGDLDILNGTKTIGGLTASPQIINVLKETQLSYVELLQVLESNFVNPFKQDETRTLQVISDDPDDQATCDVSKLSLSGLNAARLVKIIRFIRLQKKLDWTVFEVDQFLTAFNITSFDLTPQQFTDQTLIPLSNVVRLKRLFGIPVPKILALFAPIDTKLYLDHSKENQPEIPSLYDQLFRNNLLRNPLDEDFKPKGAGLTGSLTSQLPVLIAALNVSPEDLSLLMKGNSLIPSMPDQLNIGNLSELLRRATLASVLKLSVTDILKAVEIIGNNPFTGPSATSQVLVFIETIDSVKSANFKLQELSYLLMGKMANISPSTIVESTARILEAIRKGLKKIGEEAGVSDLTSDVAIKASAESLVIDVICSAFKIDHATARAILQSTVKFTGDPSKNFLEALLINGFYNSTDPLFTLDPSKNPVPSIPEYFDSYKHAEKVAFLARKLKLNAEELSFLTTNSTSLQINALLNNQVPVPYAAFENLLSLVHFRNLTKLASPYWFELLAIVLKNEPAAKNNFANALSSALETDAPTIEFLLGEPADTTDKGFLNLQFPADFLEGRNILQLIHCIKLAQQAGEAIEEFTTAVNNNDSNHLLGLLKSRHSEREWLKVIKPISNQLRIRRRDGLVAFLLNDAEMKTFREDNLITDTNSLFEHLLIDVEMDACMVTSRIKQAISSIQLFIDRCLMKLEAGVLLDNDFAFQWNTWRKQYRVWEVNRKIFLYPENWIESELRDDKSPFFEELESKLRQSEVTPESAKEVLLNYLENLDQVSNLEVVSLFSDENTGITHVFGRTRNIPHQYYYRTKAKGLWSPWKKVDVDVEGDHILAVVWNSRLMLFWGAFTEKQEESDSVTIPEPGSEMGKALKYFEMKLAWSELKNGKWSSKKISRDPLLINFKTIGTQFFKKEQVSLSSLIREEELFIRIFVPIRSDVPTDILYNDLGAFYFNGCNSSPEVKGMDSSVDGLKLKFIFKNKGYNCDQMFLGENGVDSLSVYKTGLYAPYNQESDLIKLFANTPGKVQLLPDHDEIEADKPETFFYSNGKSNFYARSRRIFRRNFFDEVALGNAGVIIARRSISPERRDHNILSNRILDSLAATPATIFDPSESETKINTKGNSAFKFFFINKYSFQAFYHPYVCDFIKKLNAGGIDGLYKEEIQNKGINELFTATDYIPTSSVTKPYPVEKVEFDFTGTYSIYNWELFFHIPLLIAIKLSQNQKFEEAREWFHYIFDPTKPSSDPNEGLERFWITFPFKEEILKGILSIEDILDPDRNPDLDTQLDYWEENPFKPHAVARLRLSGYMRTTVMKYIDNLIAWGDQLFQKDTIESINEASLLYILASNILGKKPEKIPARAIPEEKPFSAVQDLLDNFSNAKIEIQSFIPPSTANGSSTESEVLMPMFCTPKNDHLLKYWDTIADRLFKIRNCMNIQGVVRQLPLFEPPLDPALLIRAAAMGLDLNSIMNDTTASLSNYRFQVMLQKANELCMEVKGLGNELLSALEKRDAEQLSLIRSRHEINTSQLIRDIKVGQRDEAKQILSSSTAAKRVIEERRDFYKSRKFTNSSEDSYFGKTKTAARPQEIISAGELLAGVSFLLPEIKMGSGFTIGATYGGANLGKKLQAGSNALSATASLFTLEASMASILASYQRRDEDWKFSARSAELELRQADNQIVASEIRLAMAEKELETHDHQISNSKEVDDFLRSKFTNEDLYDYMVGQIAAIYFQSYQLAYNTAKKAEKCFQHELGTDSISYIQFGHWDSLKKGLLSGEKLQYDLRRLENAYFEQNQREFEITKHISLATLNANAILDIRREGNCTFQIPELLFEMDFPGHYFRRIKSIGISMPCIAGPYTSVSSQLTLNRSFIRSNDQNGEIIFDFANPSADFREANCRIKSIATSNGQGDMGTFEFNFRDDRYLPFEGAGVISEWSLELPAEARQFDYHSISDVIVTIRYTSKDSTSPNFKTAVNTKLRETIEESVNLVNENGGLFKLFSLKNDFPNLFHQIKSDESATPVTKEVSMGKIFFPFFARQYEVIFKECFIFNKNGSGISIPMTTNNTSPETINDTFKISLTYNPADIKNQEDVILLINYMLS